MLCSLSRPTPTRAQVIGRAQTVTTPDHSLSSDHRPVRNLASPTDHTGRSRIGPWLGVLDLAGNTRDRYRPEHPKHQRKPTTTVTLAPLLSGPGCAVESSYRQRSPLAIAQGPPRTGAPREDRTQHVTHPRALRAHRPYHNHGLGRDQAPIPGTRRHQNLISGTPSKPPYVTTPQQRVSQQIRHQRRLCRSEQSHPSGEPAASWPERGHQPVPPTNDRSRCSGWMTSRSTVTWSNG
jgi:hypothetical protein